MQLYIVPRYGTMHVVATNIILWIRTLIKETLEEVSEIGEKHLKKENTAESYTVENFTVFIYDSTAVGKTSGEWF
jgi:hypothetical protein